LVFINDVAIEVENKSIIKKFIEHNKRVFSREASAKVSADPLVLFEFNNMHSSHIAYSYLANVLAKKTQATIWAFSMGDQPSLVKRMLYRWRRKGEFTDYDVYRSFGVEKFISISINSSQKKKAQKVFDVIHSGLHSKQDLEVLKINGVAVGNLFYDSYLKEFKKPTIDLALPEFKNYLLNSIELFIFWEDFFNNNQVQAINVSHCVYNLAIPLRLAVSRDIPVFQASATHIYRLSKRNLFAYNDFHYFPERFAALPEAVKQVGLLEAEHRIKRRLGGEVGVDMTYSKKSAFGTSRHTRLLQESAQTKILIATHCFFDSPHSYGDNIFPDFYEWLDFLGLISEETNYDWYIKTHPDYLPGTMDIVESFIVKYPKFTLLPSDASHHQIIEEGIDFVLTVYGTIGFEYAALGIPVINASQNNPHTAYDFNLHAKNAADYRRMLMGLEQLDFKIDRQQVYEYYFMRHIYSTQNLFFCDYEKVVTDLGGYSEQFTPAAYDKWLNEWDLEKHSSINSALSCFIQSGDFRMDYSHFGREFTLETVGDNQ